MARRSSAPTSSTSKAERAIISSGFSSATYPQLVDGYARLYANGAKRVPRAYADAVRTAVSDARDRVGMTARTRPDGAVTTARTANRR